MNKKQPTKKEDIASGKRMKMSTVEDVHVALDELNKIEQNIESYFIYDSDFYRALQRHFDYGKDSPFYNRKLFIPVLHKAHGSVSLRRAYSYSDKKTKLFCLVIDFSYYKNGDDYDNVSCLKELHIAVPYSLETNFSQRKFDAWIKGLIKERDAVVEKEERKEYDRLHKKFENDKNPTKK